ncbi:threonine/homoserine/homoserine lactone efflux protein [Rhizobium petrolearium]|uniref:LysE family translocator n=1 Tax=Neorhizobium petrolearium TaxID=515361 RepID=UPI001AE21ED4|nr:LysE family translocator [Neorhizobium petrolearium]MBP1846338.1 threonine/homoserine/homoserine lactone efflux protein [Neorhizobium petrolearium]
MTYQTILAIALFSFVGSVSPGPSNFMLLTSGTNFGFWRTLPQIFGITIGLSSVLLAVGFGLGSAIHAYPPVGLLLKIAGSAYLLYLAWRIAMSRAVASGETAASRPLTFLESAAFQWVNPKAWVAALTAMAAYASDESPFVSVLAITLVIAIVNLPSVAVWAGFGMALRTFLTDPMRLKWFNIVMGLLLVATLLPLMM